MAPTEIYTLSLHDALPISTSSARLGQSGFRPGEEENAQDSGGTSRDRKSTRLNSSHVEISYAVFCLKKKKKIVTVLFNCTPTKSERLCAALDSVQHRYRYQ